MHICGQFASAFRNIRRASPIHHRRRGRGSSDATEPRRILPVDLVAHKSRLSMMKAAERRRSNPVGLLVAFLVAGVALFALFAWVRV